VSFDLHKHIIIYLAVPSLHPLNLSMYVGNKALFQCISETPISWGFDGKILPSNVKIRGALLIIPKIQKKNEGIYTCTTKDSGGREYNLQGRIQVLFKIKNCKFFCY